jgi:hypothetical protein
MKKRLKKEPPPFGGGFEFFMLGGRGREEFEPLLRCR